MKLINPPDYNELAQRTIERKRMLTALIQSLNAPVLKISHLLGYP